jgi:hypothetical protein
MRLLFLLFIIWALPTQAQDSSGQFCVRAFEDRNANGVRDPDEVFIQAGLTANLQDADGVVIATQRIEDSPTRSQGLICFQNLTDGQYGLFVTTLDFIPTTADSFVTGIQAGQLPALLEYGGQRIAQQTVATPLESTSEDTDDGLQRILVAFGGGLGAMVIVSLIGLVIFFIFLRPKADHPKQTPQQPPPDPDAAFRPPPKYDDFQDL